MLSLIAAMTENRVIGHNNQLPWHMPADLKRFKELTSGHAVIMGRKTFDSIHRKALPNRRNIVVTRQNDLPAHGAEIAHDLDEAIRMATSSDKGAEVFILGGSEIFRLAMMKADRIYLTVIHATIEGDSFFPPIDQRQWFLADNQHFQADSKNQYAYSFQTFERK